ncbi:hypothetical protein BKA66DRAFT_569694 [Pyrenochaeta sp. MPI-SDFR-AT-0127]|nr:hypothetical protein BKA66DRAFT_569694 [Pyrenochaeta sp. MPI-SDFR-AT-0127]
MAEQVLIVDRTAYNSVGKQLPEAKGAIQDIRDAASEFLFITGTKVTFQTQESLLSASHASLGLLLHINSALVVHNGSVARRGYIPLGGEHAHGHMEWKEGLYVGPEHSDDHPLIFLPLHSKNQFPDQVSPNMPHAVLEYIEKVKKLGKTLTTYFP